MESLDLSVILTAVFGVLTTIFGGLWAKYKPVVSKLLKLLREALEVATALEDAIKDDKVDKKEVEKIRKELADVKRAYEELKK